MLPGIPMGVDSSSHIYKVMFILKSLKEYGYIPFWTSDWYGGTPLLFLYPPLSYIICSSISLTGLNPISSYKLVEIVFYLLAPFSIYKLGRELGLSYINSWIAALLFSLSPAVIENLLFYDRFPNILSIPVICFFLIYFVKYIFKRFEIKSLVLSAFLLSFLILIHHLSALLAVLISVIVLLGALFKKKRILYGVGGLIFIVLLSLGLSALWVLPFFDSVSLMSINPFYNRNVIDITFSKFTFFWSNSVISSFGIIPFLLSFVMLGLFLKRENRAAFQLFAGFLSSLLIGLAFFELGVKMHIIELQVFSQIIVASAFTILIVKLIIIQKSTKGYLLDNNFIPLWFIIFLLFGLGGFMVPFASIKSPPYIDVHIVSFIWSKLDVHRFWLYLTIPASIMAAPIFHELFKKRMKKRIYMSIIILFSITLISSGVVKAAWSLTQPINPYLPQDYNTQNQSIPSDFLEYFSQDRWEGRILAIHCPFWIYLIPYYLDNKALIDGWYPQGKILEPLYVINDYRFNDLEASRNNTERLNHWNSLLDKADILGINWVIIGGSNNSFKSSLMSSREFVLVHTTPYGEGELTIYRSITAHKMISWRENSSVNIDFFRLAPDKIQLTIYGEFDKLNITIKEAYFPTWNAWSGERKIDVLKDESNFIVLYISDIPKVNRIILFQIYDWSKPIYVSMITFLIIVLSLAVFMRRN